MIDLIRSSLSAALAATLAACGTPSTPALDAAGAARLDTLRQAPESAGSLIYDGAVFALGATGAAPLFSYQRRIGSSGDGLSSAHITRDQDGEVIIVEAARFTPTYELQRFEAVNKQAGYSGTVTVTGGRHLEYVLNEGGTITKASEDVAAAVVSGPSLHGFILEHWQDLAAGRRIPVRMIVMAKKHTYGFEIGLARSSGERTVFSVTPTNLLVRLALDPLQVEFDSSTRNVVRYVGRVPPMQRAGGGLKALDASVEYTMNVPTYR